MRIIFCALGAAAAWWIGGWEWALLGALATAALLLLDADGESTLSFAGVSLLWLFAFWISGDRRLFFPYAMQFAARSACLAAPLGARVGTGLALIAVFLGIRVAQRASREVLIFELVVALAIFAFALRFQSAGGKPLWIGALASLFAFASLAL